MGECGIYRIDQISMLRFSESINELVWILPSVSNLDEVNPVEKRGGRTPLPTESRRSSLQFEEGIERTVRWYLDNEEWLNNVTSAEYQTYYDNMYKSK